MKYQAAVVSILFGLANSVSAQNESGGPDFAREVLPILSDKCFVCHGPDAEEDEVRLDSFEGATVDLGGYKAIDSENLSDSELIHRISDKDDPMPPEKAEKKLSDAEREVLIRWVKAGGKFEKHWAFVAPEKSGGDAASIDFFVRKRLSEKKIEPAKTASQNVLARRAALVLTGLPPELEQLEEFRKSGDYESLVDELLASSRFGEHQARYWLDAVRYGDTHGLHLDNKRGIYPYRDWVVKAFNEDLPFDDFITWQLAGDLLPDPGLEQLTATGYVRMNPSTSEGGAIPAEFQAKNNFDRTENFGTVFLGMTLNCARCHTHKYDPILHREYFELLAFFNSTAESPMDGNSYTYAPILEVPGSISDWDRWKKLAAQREALLKKIDTKVDQEKATAYANSTAAWKAENWQISKAVKLDSPAPAPDKKDAWTPVKGLPGTSGEKFGNGEQARWVSFDLQIPVAMTLNFETNGSEKSEATLGGKKIAADFAKLDLELGTHRIELKLNNGDRRARVYVKLENPWEPLTKSKWADCSEDARLEMAADPNGALFDGKMQKLAADLQAQVAEVKRNFTTTLIAKDLPKPRETKILERGEYDQPIGEPLQPGTFAVMGEFPEDAPRNRLGLAKWTVSRDNPLVSRVLINRVWQSIFGEGLVRSPEDFGLQGKQPTHPELLDWLAVELQESGWDYKSLIKKMVMSDTFRQDSAWREDLKDPENLLLARGPAFRLDAEVIRDTGLWASGLLRDDMGGEGVKPYQPEGMWIALAHPASNTKSYVPDTGEVVNRRSLYVYWKRTSPHPMMTLFDAPSRESSCVRRSRGNTPLQSLGLLNEPQRMEMSRALAAKLMKSADSDEARLETLFGLLACRAPSDLEKKACLDLLGKSRERYQTASDDAKDLAQPSSEKLPEDELAEMAAWTQVAATVLASDMAILLH